MLVWLKKEIEKEKKYTIKKKSLLNNNSNLYYLFSKDERTGTSYFTYPDKNGKYFTIQGVEKGREYSLNININHPILNNFSWERNGYYLIKTDKKIERNNQFGRPWSDGGMNNPSNFNKWIEVNDKVTITNYDISEADLIERERNNHPSENSFVESQNKNFLEINNLTWWIGVVVILYR